MRRQGRGDYDKRDDYENQWHSSPEGELEGILATALSGTSCLWDVPTTAEVTVLKRDSDTKALIDPNEVSVRSEIVYNSDPDLTNVPVGTYVRFKRINGIYQFTYVGCDDATAGCGSSSSSSSTGGV